MRTAVLAVAVVLALAGPLTGATTHPTPATHYQSLINDHHAHPTGMTVVVVPSAYVARDGTLLNPTLLTIDVGTQAVLEAIDYWNWALREFEDEHPQLAHVTYTTKVLGVDATLQDVADARILVVSAMVNDRTAFLFHLGLGLPTYPPYFVQARGSNPMELCTVWNTGAGSRVADVHPMRLRNLALHEFGHCLAAGHTHGSDSFGTPYPSAVKDELLDPMAGAVATYRQCISNLNMAGLAEAYQWLPGAWQPHDGQIYMRQADYDQTCMPTSLARF
ncbi:MAG TPA: hypothetical protein VM681_06905 [Candidatus Thermoplasmatota archaeon]|nr:hypothetical protein [Candidatus Thermoplasmatota archaeon]